MLSADEARLLDRLTVSSASATASVSAGGLRRARARGPGLEFHEYRHYEPGDDPRSIDWTVEARLRQLVVRVSRAVGDLRVHTLVDVSASMRIGTPDKLSCAARIAAALCYVAIERRDAAGVSTFDHRIRTHLPPSTGRPQLFHVLESLQGLQATEASSIDAALLSYGAAVRGPGVVVVLSDFFEPGAGLAGLRSLLGRGLTPAVVQVVASQELRPMVDDEVELLDVEEAPDRHASPRVVVDAAAVEVYRMRLAEHADSLRSFCSSRHLPWVRVESDAPFATWLSALETGGFFAGLQ
jgi:uncharacterized protein (DUF58 family)